MVREDRKMADVPVFMVVNLEVIDASTYRSYEKGFFPLLKKYGGAFLSFDDNPMTLEGLSPREGRMIIFQFPSEQSALDWFNDPDYQALSQHRRDGTRLEFLTMIRGMPAR